MAVDDPTRGWLAVDTANSVNPAGSDSTELPRWANNFTATVDASVQTYIDSLP